MWWAEGKKRSIFHFRLCGLCIRTISSFWVFMLLYSCRLVCQSIAILVLDICWCLWFLTKNTAASVWQHEKKIDRDDDIWKRSKRDKTRMPMQWWYGTTSIRPLNYCICHQFVLSTPLWKSLLGRMLCKWVSESARKAQTLNQRYRKQHSK